MAASSAVAARGPGLIIVVSSPTSKGTLGVEGGWVQRVSGQGSKCIARYTGAFA